MRDVDPDFQRKIDDWNDQIGGPSKIALAWNPRTERWVVYAIPVQGSNHPLARNDITKKMCSRLPDDSGREGVLLFSWCMRDHRHNDVGFLPLDDRLFETLSLCLVRDHRHYEETMERPQEKKEIEEKKSIRVIAGAQAEYFKNYDNLTISMNPATRSGGDWRHRIR